MVDLGQKRWKKFHLFYWNKIKEINIKKAPISNFEIGAFYFKKKETRKKIVILEVFILSPCLFYFSKAYLLATSVQLITLKKASI